MNPAPAADQATNDTTSFLAPAAAITAAIPTAAIPTAAIPTGAIPTGAIPTGAAARHISLPALPRRGACPEHPGCVLLRCAQFWCSRPVHLLHQRGQPRRFCSTRCRVAEHRRLRNQ